MTWSEPKMKKDLEGGWTNLIIRVTKDKNKQFKIKCIENNTTPAKFLREAIEGYLKPSLSCATSSSCAAGSMEEFIKCVDEDNEAEKDYAIAAEIVSNDLRRLNNPENIENSEDIEL